MSGPDIAAIIGAFGLFITACIGAYAQLRTIHRAVNSNLEKQNDRIEELHATVAHLVKALHVAENEAT